MKRGVPWQHRAATTIHLYMCDHSGGRNWILEPLLSFGGVVPLWEGTTPTQLPQNKSTFWTLSLPVWVCLFSRVPHFVAAEKQQNPQFWQTGNIHDFDGTSRKLHVGEQPTFFLGKNQDNPFWGKHRENPPFWGFKGKKNTRLTSLTSLLKAFSG